MKRHGASILEVLFAILIVSIGLLGSLAVMVVAGGTATKARVTDDTSFLARKATAEFDSRGMRQPGTWRQWNGTAFVPVTPRPLTAYCIDSRFCVENTANWAAASEFPYQHADNPPGARMQRVAFLGEQPVPNLAAQQLFAQYVFHVGDDLAYDRPKDHSLPANQMWVENGGVAVQRSSEGMYSWMATLVPTVNAPLSLQPNRQSVSTRPLGGGWTELTTHEYFPLEQSTHIEYLLSIVVFYQRPAGLVIDSETERAVNMQYMGGGEVRLTASTPERLNAKRGEWMLLSGTRTVSNGQVTRTIPYFAWHRINAIDEPAAAGGVYEAFASVIGGDWDTTLSTQQAIIVQGVVAVHEKTVKLLYSKEVERTTTVVLPP